MLTNGLMLISIFFEIVPIKIFGNTLSTIQKSFKHYLFAQHHLSCYFLCEDFKGFGDVNEWVYEGVIFFNPVATHGHVC